MTPIDGRVRLSELAQSLGVTNSALLQHLKNNSGLGDGAVKLGNMQTGDYLLSIDSVLNFILWARRRGRKLDMETLDRVQGEVECLKDKQ